MAVARRESHAAAYLKSKAAIRDLLALMGAHDTVLAFEEAAVIAGDAGARQPGDQLRPREPGPAGRRSPRSARRHRRARRLDLDARLRQVAELRLRHPHLSLAELGRRARPPLPKSTVAGRMRALTALTTRPDPLTDR